MPADVDQAAYRIVQEALTNAGRHAGAASACVRLSYGPDARTVVILTNYELDEYVFHALRAGASGFVVKDTEPADLLQALRVAVRGDALLTPTVTRRLISEFVSRPPDAVSPKGLEALTNREGEVVALVTHGFSNDEIAESMVLSPTTVKTHVSRAMTKLHARDRAQLVVLAYNPGSSPRA